jgi:putative flippase GtrA
VKPHHKEIISYLFWGIITTIINFFAYILFRTNNILSVQIATILAWLISVLAAFLSNKFFVFKSFETSFSATVKEGGLFFVSRIFSGILDVALMTFAVHFAVFPEKVSKAIVNIIIIAVNYLASKTFIFRKNDE